MMMKVAPEKYRKKVLREKENENHLQAAGNLNLAGESVADGAINED